MGRKPLKKSSKLLKWQEAFKLGTMLLRGRNVPRKATFPVNGATYPKKGQDYPQERK